jgi:hypothetical protein
VVRYRDKKVVGVFCAFRAALHNRKHDGISLVSLGTLVGLLGTVLV